MNEWFKEATYRSMIEISLSALKFCLLSNGGAAVALMTLFGAKSEIFQPSEVSCSMGLFLTGVAAGGFAHVFAYLTQLKLHQENMNANMPSKHPILLSIAITFVFVSLIMFVIGSMQTLESISSSLSVTS